ncbi:MAG: class I SAM-dependent methyltransferase [Actinomycetota bacterium]|nr:class I SAM-dependent methyltransferase [Actinomycetota bacterium]
MTTTDQGAASAPSEGGAQPDPDEVAAYAFNVWSYKKGEMVSLMIHLGDRLGLYREMAGAGPLTVDELAERTGYARRWLLEWMRGQVAAGLLHHTDVDDGADTFELTAVGAHVLADEESSLAFAAGAFAGPTAPHIVDRLVDAFTTGRGLTYDELGESAAHRTDRMLGPWARLALVPTIVPALDGVAAKLGAGASVADIGCGAGLAIAVLARAYPNSHFVGWDPSSHAVEMGERRVEGLGLDNVTFENHRGEDLPAGAGYDLILAFDCIHDMTHPAEVLAAMRGAIADDGTVLLKDIRSTGEFRRDLRNPMLALYYGFSVTTCMSSALAEPDGAGLGTLGFPPPVAERMCREAGFTRFETHDFEDPSNLYYEVRP